MAEAILDREGMNEMSSLIAVQALGHDALSGRARVKLAALKRYTLIKGQGESVALTPAAKKLVLLDRSDPEWRDLARRAATAPRIFGDLEAIFPSFEDLPSAANIIRRLRVDLGFSARGAKSFEPVFRATMGFVHSLGDGSGVQDVSDGLDEHVEQMPMGPAVQPSTGGARPTAVAPTQPAVVTPTTPLNTGALEGVALENAESLRTTLTFALGGGVNVTVNSTEQLTGRQLRRLVKMLEITAEFEDAVDEEEFGDE